MLRSTHKQNQPPQLPEGWTEHRAPSGHSYYYHAASGKSTYQRPTAQLQETQPPAQPQPLPVAPAVVPFNYGPPFSDGPSQFQGNQESFRGGYRGRGGHGRGGHDFQNRRRQQAEDRPKHKYALPDCVPWLLIKTKLGRRFVYNPETKESFWKIPPDVMEGVQKFNLLEEKRRERRERGEPSEDEEEKAATPEDKAQPVVKRVEGAEDLSDEYEEVEVTDDEGEEGEDHPSKKQRTGEEAQDEPVEFDEDDVAYQLKMMGEEYGLDPAEYGNPYEEELEEGAEGLPLTEEDSRDLFRDMLDDHGINPWTPWESLIEEGRIVQDDRYTVYTNMKSRKEAWSDWSKNKMVQLKAQRESQAKQDPRVPYMDFLQNHASPKLYWPEFKRKYRKDAEMNDRKVTDKDREKWYREHTNRLKLPSSTLKSDLTALLKSVPLWSLNRSTQLAALPSAILADIRFISLPPSTRDPLVETWISTLPPAPEQSELNTEDSEEAARKRADRERRKKALADREKRVQEEKDRQRKELSYGRGRLRDEERELERAMNVGKQGLRGQLGSLGDEENKEQGMEE